MKTIYVVPTRGRPTNARRLARAWQDTIEADTTLLFVFDEDDVYLANYLKVMTDFIMTPQIRAEVGPRRRLGGSLNHWGPRLVEKGYEAIGFMGDDHLPLTQGWDEILTSVLVPGGVVYANDLVQGPNLPTAVLMDACIIERLGWMIPPGLIHMYLDNWWKDLGTALGTLVYRGDVIIEHLHPITGRVQWDDRYREVNAGEVYEHDENLYREFLEDGKLDRAVKAIQEVLT